MQAMPALSDKVEEEHPPCADADDPTPTDAAAGPAGLEEDLSLNVAVPGEGDAGEITKAVTMADLSVESRGHVASMCADARLQLRALVE